MDANQNNIVDGLVPEFCPELERIVVCLDMDEFRVQVEGRENQDVGSWMEQNHPIVVVTRSSKRLLSVNYAARRLGIKPANDERRTLDDLIYEYPGLKVHYPRKRYGREDMFTPEKYMNDVYKALEIYRQRLANPNSIVIEWAKMEEIYVDITDLVEQRCGPMGRLPFESRMKAFDSVKEHPSCSGFARIVFEGKDESFSCDAIKSKIQDWNGREEEVENMRLIHAGIIANAMINAIKVHSRIQASAGVSYTKLLARLACPMNKPEGVTIISFPGFARLSSVIKIGKIHGYGQSLAEKLAECCYQNYRIRLETLADVQKLHGNAIGVLQDLLTKVLPRMQQSTVQRKAENLLNSCHGNDNQTVQHSSFFKKTMETSARIPRGATYGKAKHILRRLCQNFVYRIWYYKRNRNLAPKVISVTVFTNTDENPPKEDLKRNLCGWLYIRDYILNRVRCYNFCLENDVEEVKVTAKY